MGPCFQRTAGWCKAAADQVRHPLRAAASNGFFPVNAAGRRPVIGGRVFRHRKGAALAASEVVPRNLYTGFRLHKEGETLFFNGEKSTREGINMNGLIMMCIAIVVLGAGYLVYGRWLAKTWGIDPNAKTPAYEFEDGVDYEPADTNVVFGHQFASIAGAGPSTAPSRPRCSAGYLCFCGCSSAACSSAPCRTLRPCTPL